MSNLVQRTLTGLIGGSLVILLIVWNIYSLTALFAVIAFLSLYEYHKLVKSDSTSGTSYFYLVLIFSWLAYLAIALSAIQGIPVRMFVLAIPITLGILLVELFSKNKVPIYQSGQNLLGILYISLPCALASHLAFPGEFTPQLLLGTLIIIWCNDIGAYFAGTSFGKHKLFERLSPKKTWEGSIGGFISGIIAAFLLSKFFGIIELRHWIACGVICILFGSLGDLIESMFKRSLNVKDSGTILPGHGGFLDRFDAFFFSIPFVYTYLFFTKAI